MRTKLTPRQAAACLALVTAVLSGTAVFAMPRFTDWTPPVSIETLPDSSSALNTASVDGCASLSRDGLTLVFNSNRTGNFDLYFAQRPDRDHGFGDPVALPAPVNTAKNESCATFGPGNKLYFSSDREDPAYDIYVTSLQAGEWTDPVNLGSGINRPGWLDETPTFYENDDGRLIMIFSSRLPNGTQGKIYQSINGAPASPLAGPVNSLASDNRPSVTHDGRTLFFDSTRPGGLGSSDVYVASRESTAEPFGDVVHLRTLSSPAFDARPSISWDGTELIVGSSRPGSESAAPDMWHTSRERDRTGPKVVDF